ncbi:L-xylulose reductase [Aureococcus anophagefferens]|nr:L-xylulose reductase [Aureococcus anophagefferens]
MAWLALASLAVAATARQQPRSSLRPTARSLPRPLRRVPRGGDKLDDIITIEPLPLAGQVALVTGGGRGIGAAIARALATRGAAVAIVYRDDEAAAVAAAAALPSAGHGTYRCDVGDGDAVAATIAAVEADLGGLDVVVNNAGVFVEHPILETTYADWRANFEATARVNLHGPANVCYCAARSMAARGVRGKIVNVGSRGALRGEPRCPPTARRRAGGPVLAVALAPAGIVVAVVAPGFVETDMAAAVLAGPDGDGIRAQSGFGRVATVDEVAEAVAFFTSPGATWCTGAVLDCNGASYLH